MQKPFRVKLSRQLLLLDHHTPKSFLYHSKNVYYPNIALSIIGCAGAQIISLVFLDEKLLLILGRPKEQIKCQQGCVKVMYIEI